MAYQRRALDIAMARERANHQAAILLAYVSEIGQAIDIHQVLRLCQAHIEQRDKALPTGKHFGVIRVGRQQGQGIAARRRVMVYKTRRFHTLTPSLEYWQELL